MIEAIKNIGEYALKKKRINLYDPAGILSVLCEDPKSSDTYRKIITIELEKTNDVSYKRVSVEDYSSDRISWYLYRKGSANGPDMTPIARITEPEKTMKNKILGWFKDDFIGKAGITPEEAAFIKQIEACLLSNLEKILTDIQSVYEPIKRNRENAILTLQFIEDDMKKYLGEFSVFKKILTAKALEKYYNKYNQVSKAENQTCSICKSRSDEVYGFVSTYSFYTVDKPGMVAGGFDQSKAWRNYPVCRHCALALEEGKKYLDEYARFQFYDYPYYLIPKPLRKDLDERVYTVLENYHDEAKTQKITTQHRILLDDTKEEIFKDLAVEENSFNNDILVFKEKNSEFKILLSVEGVFPSRLAMLFEAKKRVDEDKLLTDVTVPVYTDRKKTGEKQLEFNFGCFWHFFGREKEQDTSSYFLDIVGRVFSGRPVSYSFLMGGIASRLERQFAQGYPTRESVMRGMATIMYLRELELLGEYPKRELSRVEVKELVEDSESERVRKAEEIFGGYAAFFDCDAKRAVFLVGALSQLLMDIQFTERGATPFRVKLQGLRLDQKQVQSLLPEIQNKLEEYGKNYYRDLEHLTSSYFLKASQDWKLSKDEISFYFVLGMNLSSAFKTVKSEVDN